MTPNCFVVPDFVEVEDEVDQNMSAESTRIN